ncbi:type II/IV secretion system ATPase subunit [Candidatus Micrarchaeota archaeon]|nr:type II/IV secretion system ATPase subunit [Candidatus Micrarchaeota archaeon]
MLRTKIDDMIDLAQKRKITFKGIANELSWNETAVEQIALILEKAGHLTTRYSVNLLENPQIIRVRKSEEETNKPETKGKNTRIDSYDITSRETHTSGQVEIINSSQERRYVYSITIPRISVYTRAYMERVKIDIANALATKQNKNQKGLEAQVEERRKIIEKQIAEDVSPDKNTLEQLVDLLLNEMYGLGELEALIADTKLEEIVINSSSNPIAVYHRKYGWLKTNVYMKNELETQNYAEQIARKVGRQISTLNPILDAHLDTGDRVNATIFPISTSGNTLTMRMFAKNPWTMVSYLKKEVGAMTPEMAALLWQAIQYEMNIIVAGGTASGKTSALNALIALVQPHQRVVTIEDTRELMLPTYQWNWVPMVTRIPNPEGLGEVTMLDLVVNALRMRPDRIVMGEIRRKREAEVLFEAMHTGHSVYGTIHADTASQVIKRLIEPPIEVPPAEVEDIHLLLVQYRDRRKNLRRTLELSEVLPGAPKPEINHVYTWKARTDSFQMVKTPRRYYEQLNLHTGMTENEIGTDQKEKVTVLEWMLKNKLEDMDDVGRVMKAYYSSPDDIVKAAEKNIQPQKVLD